MATSHARRGLGILLGGAPIWLLAGSVANVGSRASTPALVVICAAAALGALNFYLSFVRRGERHVSGFPLVGSVLVIAGTILGFGSAACAAIGAVAIAIDTGGGPWFVIATWRDASFWDYSVRNFE